MGGFPLKTETSNPCWTEKMGIACCSVWSKLLPKGTFQLYCLLLDMLLAQMNFLTTSYESYRRWFVLIWQVPSNSLSLSFMTMTISSWPKWKVNRSIPAHSVRINRYRNGLKNKCIIACTRWFMDLPKCSQTIKNAITYVNTNGRHAELMQICLLTAAHKFSQIFLQFSFSICLAIRMLIHRNYHGARL